MANAVLLVLLAPSEASSCGNWELYMASAKPFTTMAVPFATIGFGAACCDITQSNKAWLPALKLQQAAEMNLPTQTKADQTQLGCRHRQARHVKLS